MEKYIFDYYPGCTLKNKARKLDECARKSAEVLGVTINEIEEWQCCGGVYTSVKNDIAMRLPSVRALISAKSNDRPLLTLCSACHNVLKSVNYDMQCDENIRNKANNYLESSYSGETKVVHYFEMLRDYVGFENIKEKVVNPADKKIAAYYGCLLLRPKKIMQFDDAENPVIMENFIKAVGGEIVVYPFRNECCGGYVSAEDEKITEKKCREISESAVSHGAEMIITACPLCMYNLKKYSKIPIKYFTEVLAQSLGIEVDCRE